MNRQREIGKIAIVVGCLTLASAFAIQPVTPTPVVVVSVEGCGVPGATAPAPAACTIPNGTGATVPSQTSTTGGYGDNQAAPLSLFYFNADGASSASLQNVLVLPQAASGPNLPVSGEYGSSSEGSVQLSGNGTYLTIMGYGVNAAAFNGSPNSYSAAPNSALAQSGSLCSASPATQCLTQNNPYIPIPRVVTLIDQYGNVTSSTGLFNIFDGNNPRSVYSADGTTFAYVSGQGTDGDATSGVFYTALGAINSAPTSITGDDAGGSESQDTRFVQINNNQAGNNDTLYISMDSKGGSYNRSYVGTMGTPPYTTTYSCATAPGGVCPTSVPNGPSLMPGFGNAGGTGRVKLTAAQTNGILASGTYVNLSQEDYFFASPTILYVADSGTPKNTSADNETTYSLCGAGGLQKWVYANSTWTWEYTLSNGLNLVKNANSKSGDTTCSTNTDGTTGLLGLTGVVSGGNVYLYATGYTIADLDPSYLFGIVDPLSATTNPGQSFTKLATAPPDSNFKGVSLSPLNGTTLPTTNGATIASVPTGLQFSSSGPAGCALGSYTTPMTLNWIPGSGCTVTMSTPQNGTTGVQYAFSSWEDTTTNPAREITAPSSPTIYTATFTTEYQLTTSAGAGGTVSPPSGFAASPATITATPNAGYYFTNFSGASTSTTNPLSLTLTGPASITANFAPLPTVVSYNVLWGSESYNVIGTTRNRLPWQITGIQVVFSEPIATATTASLTGVTATALSGLGTSTLTWTIAPIALGNFPTTLSGSGASAIKDAAGNPLGAGAGFSQNLKVLYGDVNDDGVVNSQDLVLVNNASKQAYNILMDLNGDGVVNATDVKLDQSRAGTSLP